MIFAKLRINCLKGIKDAEKACSAKIYAKRRLTDLTLCWNFISSRKFDFTESMFNNLLPPKYLRNMSIKRYMGARPAFSYISWLSTLRMAEERGSKAGGNRGGVSWGHFDSGDRRGGKSALIVQGGCSGLIIDRNDHSVHKWGGGDKDIGGLARCDHHRVDGEGLGVDSVDLDDGELVPGDFEEEVLVECSVDDAEQKNEFLVGIGERIRDVELGLDDDGAMDGGPKP
ncbi:hypothetical protein IEQ34_013233 [Dendrobium chrysotoxum]|uniref:R13L1/DRL21-like LRR repeat region domain-containing protein n=1 Tax=Dendrobium chrysotoxum TaxID=161865 RepID=A0AAV7GQG4_DENCH|nr:hypothetical protein IEQ34_013233 [Dendrobium chrysotoxum]